MDNTVIVKEYKCPRDAAERVLVSLPSVWISQNELKEGDTLEFRQMPGSTDLIIRKQSSNGQQVS